MMRCSWPSTTPPSRLPGCWTRSQRPAMPGWDRSRSTWFARVLGLSGSRGHGRGCVCWCPGSGGSWRPACSGGRDVVDCRACLLERDDHRGEDVGGEVELGVGELVEFGELPVWDGDLEGTEVRLELLDRAGADDGRGHVGLLPDPGQCNPT